MIVDNFLDNFDWARAYCDRIDYADEVNPVDGVTYPGINRLIPPAIGGEVIYKAQSVINAPIVSVLQFFRLTQRDVDVPHQAHNDKTMADYVLLLYMNREQDCRGGTEFVRHIASGLERNPTSDEEQAIWQRDTNIREAWDVTATAQMKQNRAIIFEADQMHRAQTPTGFGDNAANGRLILSTFMKVAQ